MSDCTLARFKKCSPRALLPRQVPGRLRFLFSQRTPRPGACSLLHHLKRLLLTYKDYLHSGKLANSSCDVDSIQIWEPNIQQYQIRLKSLGRVNRIESVCDLAYDLQFWSALYY